ncbi:urease accessory protein UreF [Solimonas sp. K1W22B-7]|uniref:urease accessory protein UreF n=1 Tax=Solimonas sp. K1W22B-7 TaxID=2303331 RepID=UPI000E32EA05|nr:urease accessory protein UreF [Solimonas sp. K1W22B-7]AXQ27537.1 urease accessory protein UreF [Solimonas sp. K1W22B-7]
MGALLQLSSPALPVGAYSYSQALESAIDKGIVTDAASAQVWIAESLKRVLGRYEAPVWCRLRAAWDAQDPARFSAWNSEFIASRETRELRAETLQMGYSLRQLLLATGTAEIPDGELCFPAAHACASALWAVPPPLALYGYLYSWLENQVMAALKAVPLGQVSGQKLLIAVRPQIKVVVEQAFTMRDEELSTQAPMLGLLSSQHETQYSRLFRS